MLNVGDYALILIALAFAVAIGAWFFSKTRIEPAGVVRSSDFSDERLRQAVIQAVKGVDVAAPAREDAERLIEELARHAAGREYANIYPGMKIEVTEHWPDARCIITGNVAVIDLWVGRSMIGKGDGIRPIQVEVNRQPTLKLETKRPIKDAWADIHSPPGKAEPVAPRLKVAVASAKPTPTQPPRAKAKLTPRR